MYKIRTCSAEETRGIGALLGKFAYPGLTLLLYGDLGMGKTVLTQGIGEALAAGGIKSPTFIIVAEHDGDLPLTHVDLYRIDAPREADALDLEQYTEDGVLVVEWAERWTSAPDEEVWKITFTHGAEENERAIEIEARGERAAQHLQEAAEEINASCKENQ